MVLTGRGVKSLEARRRFSGARTGWGANTEGGTSRSQRERESKGGWTRRVSRELLGETLNTVE